MSLFAGALLSILLVPLVALAREDGKAIRAARSIEVLPGAFYLFDEAPPQQEALLRDLVSATPQDLEQLLNSPSSRDRSAAVYILAYRGDVNRLATLSAWLDSEEPALPVSQRGAAIEPHFSTTPRTLGVYLGRIYYSYFGSTASTSADFAARYGDVQDFEVFARVWRVRLWSAKVKERDSQPVEEGHSFSAIKSRVLRLPPEIAMYVMIDTQHSGFFTDAEVKQVVRSISVAGRAKLTAGREFAPPDPEYSGEGGDWIREHARQILAEQPE